MAADPLPPDECAPRLHPPAGPGLPVTPVRQHWGSGTGKKESLASSCDTSDFKAASQMAALPGSNLRPSAGDAGSRDLTGVTAPQALYFSLSSAPVRR